MPRDVEIGAADGGGVQEVGGCEEPLAGDNAGCAEAVLAKTRKAELIRLKKETKASLRLKGRRQRDPRLPVFAANLNKGETTGKAGRGAGYSNSYMQRYGYKLAKSDEVVQLRLELAGRIKPGTLGGIAKTLLLEDLVKPPKGAKNAKARLGIIRTGLEVDGMIGGPNELHLHQHGQLPKVVEEMLLSKMKEILGKEVIDGAIVSEGAGSEGQSREDNEGVQVGESSFGFQDRAIG